MIKKLTKLTKALLVTAGLCVGATSAWAASVKETYDFKKMITAGYSKASTTPSQSLTYYLYDSSGTTAETTSARLDYIYDESGNTYSIGSHIYLYAHETNANLSNSNYWWIRTGSSYNVLYNNKTNQNQRFALVGLSKGDKFTITFGTGSLAFQTANVYLESDNTKTLVTASSIVDNCTSVESGKTYVVSDEALGEDGSINVALVTKKANVSISKIVIERPSVTETIDSPTFNVSYNGANRIVSIIDGVTNSLNSGVTTYYTIDGTEPTTNSSVYTEPIEISAACTIKAISKAVNGTISSVGSQEVTVGKLTVAAPTVTFSSMVANGNFYSPQYSIANGDNSSILGTPTPTLSATFNGTAVDITSNTFTPNTSGTLVVTASADGYNSSSTEYAIAHGLYTCQATPNFNEIALADLESTLGGTWTINSLTRWPNWTRKAGKTADLSDDSSEDNNYANASYGSETLTIGNFSITRNRTTAPLTVLAGYGIGDDSYAPTLTLSSPIEDGIVEYSLGKNTPTTTFYTISATDEEAGTWTLTLEAANALRYCKYYTPLLTFAESDYYLKNKATGAYFAAGKDWGTQAITNDLGHIVSLEIQPSGKYYIDTHITGDSHYLTQWLWVDNTADEFTFADAGEGYYTISYGDSKVTAAASGELLTLTSGTGDDTKWQLLTPAEWKAENVARLDAATASSGVDATFYITAPNFNRNDNLNSEWQGNPNIAGKDNDNCNWNGEKFTNPYATFDVYQELTGLKPGAYKLTVQGFYRNGLDNASDANDNLAILYANSVEVPLVNINKYGYTETHSTEGFTTPKSGYYVPDSQSDAGLAFNAGNYENELFVVVGNDGALRIGVKKTAATGADKDWTVFDNFRLTYYGTVASATITSAGYATFASDYALDFGNATGVKAYYATAVTDGKVTMEKIEGTVAAGTGMLLQKVGDEAISIPVVTSGDALSGNLFVRGTGGAISSEEGKMRYVLGIKDNDASFYKIGTEAANVGTDKAYLEVVSGAGARLVLSFSDDVTGIKAVDTVDNTIDGFYNLNGQRVAAPQKGLYIVNGKKVIMK